MRTQEDIDTQIAHLERELLELKRQRNELSSVSALPTEILCQILLLATAYPHDGKDFISLPERFRVEHCIGILCHVSHSWRSTALDCPQLWAEIDIRMATDERQVDFMLKHAHPLPISLHVDTIASGFPACQYGQLNALDPVIRILSGGFRFDKLALCGSLSFLTELLRVAQPSTLYTLQIAVSDKRSLGYTAAGASVAQHPLFAREASELRTLVLDGCAIPLTTPVLLRSPHLTSLSIHIQRESRASQVLDMLRAMRQIQRLNLDFRGPFTPSPASLDPVHLPCLSEVVLRGDSGSILTTFSNLRLSATQLNLNLHCVFLNQSHTQPAGALLFKALGQLCRPGDNNRMILPSELYSPQVLGLGRPPFAQGPDGVCSIMTHEEVALSDVGPVPATAASIVFSDQSTRSYIPWTQWHPLMLANHPSDLQPTIGWSMSRLTMVGFLDDADYPDSFWGFLSECPEVRELAIAPSHVLKLLPYLSIDNGGLPFPSLSHISVEGSASQNAIASSAVGKVCEPHLEPLLQALQKRRILSQKYGVAKEWMLDELRLDSYISTPSQLLVRTAHAERLVRWVLCGGQEEQD